MLTRYPDKPVLSSHLVLPRLRDGEFLCQFKMDGWRCVIEVGGGGCTFTTRHNKPCPVTGNVASQTFDRLRHLPAGTLLDSEWMDRRAGDAERFWIFDLLRFGQAWTLNDTASERFAQLTSACPADLIVPHTCSGYAGFFERSKSDPTTEGVVLKRCDSKYIGSVRGCCDNPGWIKVRWRDGSDGKKLVA